MSKCSIKQCSARRIKNQPLLTFHRFPENEALKRKWLEAIGKENTNPKIKNLFVCSLHFSEGCINRTLDVARLHDNVVPSLFLPQSQHPPDVPTSSELQGLLLKENLGPQLKQLQEADKPVLHENIPSTSSRHQDFLLKENVRPTGKKLHTRESLQKTCAALRKKIKRLNERVRRQKKQINNLKDIIAELEQKKMINNEQSLLLKDCAGSEEFLKRQIAKAKGLPLENKYSEEIRKFALTLNFLSPRAYEYVRSIYNMCLPHPRTLSKWYQNVHAEAGFTTEAFDTLAKLVEQSEHPVICTLVLDEMSIRKSLTWDPKLQKYFGRVDYGHNVDSDSLDEASQCLVFLLACMNGSWKLPIGYFFITSLTGDQKCSLVKNAVQLTEEAGCKVVAVTCDGPASNFSMFNSLGCDLSQTKDNSKTSFECSNSKIHAFIDPCHALKLIRNTFGEFRILIDAQQRVIDYKYVELLLEIQEKQGLHMGTKLSKAHIIFEKQKMKVRLATQLLSNSVADALEYCRSYLNLEEFIGCEATVNFIRMINDVFDVLNSHSIRPPGWKKALCPENIGLVTALFESAIGYIRKLQFDSGELVIKSPRKTGFVGLIIDMYSALSLYRDLVETQKILKYVPLYKVSQDHIELFFSSIRSKGGFNNNPNAVQFRAAYKRLLIRAEIRDGGLGNCIPLEQVNILTCSSKTPIKNINELTTKKKLLKKMKMIATYTMTTSKS